MRIYSILGLLAVSAAALAQTCPPDTEPPPPPPPPEAEAFYRTYTEGEKVQYKVRIRASLSSLPLDLRMNVTRTVKKIYENGDADIEILNKDAKLKTALGEVKVPVPAKQNIRFDKQGVPLTKANAAFKGINLDFLQYLDVLVAFAPTVGESYPIEYVNPEDTTRSVRGTWKVDKIDGEIARVTSILEVAGIGSTPVKLLTTVLLNVTTLITQKVEGQATGVPGVPSGEVKFTVEWIKPPPTG